MSVSATTSLAITNPLVKYRALLATRAIRPDPAQHRLAIHLAKLYERLKDYEPELEYSHKLDQIARAVDSQRSFGATSDNHVPPPRQSRWRSFLAAEKKRDSLALTRKLTSHESAVQMTSPQGLMLHGEVGTGKSMLIDLFADCIPHPKKRRSHFNTFMLEIFAKLDALRASRSQAGSSPLHSQLAFSEDDYSLLWLAKDMIQTSPILFLDEFQMPDRVASKILSNLMTGFFQLGGVLVATSNRMPEELAKAAGFSYTPPPQQSLGWTFKLERRNDGGRIYGGRNETTAFLEILRARCEFWEMEGGKDWRRDDNSSVAPVKEVGHASLHDSVTSIESLTSDEDAEAQDETCSSLVKIPKRYDIVTERTGSGSPLDSALIEATGVKDVDRIDWTAEKATVYGRKLQIPKAYEGVTLWTFDELCRANLGPADFLTLASVYHTVLITEVPVLNWLMKNEARRFITLLDALYECRCKLFVSAAAGPDDIFFPEEQKKEGEGDEEKEAGGSIYSETLSEVYQDATAPFRPNILTQNPNYAEPDMEPDYTHARLAGLLRADSLEDGSLSTTSRGEKGGSSNNPFGRSFGRTDAEMEPKSVDPDEARASVRPDFQKTSAFTGEDERFAYKRAQSRLWEMCSQRWWARNGTDWHRPLPKAIRRWEGLDQSPDIPTLSHADPVTASEVRMEDSVPDSTRPEQSFRRPSSVSRPPFRPEREPPKKISWTHIWGTIKWPGGNRGRAGAWGQGPEGLKDRGNEKR